MLPAYGKMEISTTELVSVLQLVTEEKRVSLQQEDLEAHSKDKSFHQAVLPQIVIWPKNSQEISEILKIANNHRVPVTAWGGGSSLEGNPIPVKGGIVLDLKRMNNVLEVFVDDLQVRVQPGIIGEELDRQLEPYGFWFAAAPGSKHVATIGGMIANNAGGMHAVKYGVVGDGVLELEVVLANGEIIRVGSRSIKSVSGYDLKSLFIASEGTLGIITEAVLKLTPLPQTKVAMLASFENELRAAETSLQFLKLDSKPAAIEFMDATYVGLVNKAKGTTLREQPTLLIELHGDKEAISLQSKAIKDICRTNKATHYQEFSTGEELTLLWKYRRAVRPVLSSLLPNVGVLSAEVGVPLSKVPALLKKAKEVSKKYGLQTVMFGHMGDGNFHGWALYELGNQKSWEKVVKLNEELVSFAIEAEGTITGEHGIGIGKRKFLSKEHEKTITFMSSIKHLFDPNGILNPGKLLP